jgi:hypothetical protein
MQIPKQTTGEAAPDEMWKAVRQGAIAGVLVGAVFLVLYLLLILA